MTNYPIASNSEANNSILRTTAFDTIALHCFETNDCKDFLGTKFAEKTNVDVDDLTDLWAEKLPND